MLFQFALSSPTPPPPPADTSVAALAEQAQAGDRAAFTELFQQFNAPICRYLAHLVGNDETALDLAQETFLMAWRGLPGLQEPARFAAWLYRIATNLARSHLRRARLVRWLPWAEPVGKESKLPTLPGPEPQLAEAEQVAEALAQLTPTYRTCLLLQLEGGFSQREIAQLLHLSEKSVSVYVSRGRQQFLAAYQRLEAAAALPQKGGPTTP
jgi:RNA polymerase sigma-70 factor (ECF subfamily)